MDESAFLVLSLKIPWEVQETGKVVVCVCFTKDICLKEGFSVYSRTKSATEMVGVISTDGQEIA